MELYHNNRKITCSATEYAELVRLGVFSETGFSASPPPQATIADINTITEKNLEETVVSVGELGIDENKFFDDMSPLTAKFLLALVHSAGQIDQSELLRRLDLESGRSLRRPVGSAHKRIREASSGRIVRICSVSEPDRDQQERLYHADGQAMEFLREHANKLQELANND